MKRTMLFYILFVLLILNILIFLKMSPDVYHLEQADEKAYRDISKNWNEGGISTIKDNKPLPFLYIQKILLSDQTTLYTRLLNFLLICANIFLIYSITKRWESLFFIVIPLFLNSMWLTVEMIEIFFLFLSFKYTNVSGFMIGLSALFRPYSLIFSILQKPKQLPGIFIPGLILAILLLYLGVFHVYLNTVIGYGTQLDGILSQILTGDIDAETNVLAAIVLIPFMVFGSKNKRLFKYGLVACIPLLIRSYSHYFLTPYSLFFLSFLMKEKDA